MKMNMPALISVESERLLTARGYLWDNWLYGFRRVRDIPRQSTAEYLASAPDVISFEELSDHGCFKSDASVEERHASERWLEQRVKAGRP